MKRSMSISVVVLLGALLLTPGFLFAAEGKEDVPEKLIPAQTITSPLKMTIRTDMTADFMGNTPGTLKIPACSNRTFHLTGLTPDNVAAYKKELQRYRVRRIELPESTTDLELKQYKDAGLLDNLTSLDLSCCRDLTDLSILSDLKNLTSLDLSLCGKVKDITPLASFKKLDVLLVHSTITNQQFQWLRDKKILANLEKLFLNGCDELTDLSGLADLDNVTVLYISSCEKLKDFSALSSMKNLTEIHICCCENLTDLSFLSGLKKLEKLDVWECDNLADLSGLAHVKCLTTIQLTCCDNLTDLSPLSGLANLVTLDLGGSKNLTDLSALSGLKHLKTFKVKKCAKLTAAEVKKLRKQLPNCSISSTEFLERPPSEEPHSVEELLEQPPVK